MILQSLVSLYEALLDRGVLELPGWSKTKVSYALNIDENGQLLDVFPLMVLEKRGKKEVSVPQIFDLPTPVVRTVGIAANFLYDNSSYFLGIDNKGKPERTRKCFEASKDLHEKLLSHSDCPAAKAICAFFQRWQPERARDHPVLKPYLDDILAGGNLVFQLNNRFVHEYPEIREIWQRHYDDDADADVMQCLVTGKMEPVAVLHPSVRGVQGAQSSGAYLVSFNARAYESYGHEKEQGKNAPVGKYAAFAYGEALKYLFSDMTFRLGDTIVLTWAEGGEPAYKSAFSAFLNGAEEDGSISDADLKRMLSRITAGLPVEWKGTEIQPENRFYVLGIAPNAARLSVRFFLQNTFGVFVQNIRAHYDRLEIVRPKWDNREILSPKDLLLETVNQKAKDKTPHPQMAGDTLRAILSGGRYPATLLNGVMLRIKAEQELTRGRAAIIKAYLLRNYDISTLKEVLTVELNQQSAYPPYLLGRLFSILEQIQQAANPGINTTIKDKYFSSACATPASVFPLLIKLSNSHLRKLDTALRVYLEKQITEVLGKLTENFPQRLSLPEQGAFYLGYYHQTQKRYEKQNKEEGN